MTVYAIAQISIHDRVDRLRIAGNDDKAQR
jgi:hypothetical protein